MKLVSAETGNILRTTMILAAFLEGIILSRREPYNWRGTAASFFAYIVRNILTVALPLVLTAYVLLLAQLNQNHQIENYGWFSVALLFLGEEFCYYWYHRACHDIRWFWCIHAVHHSPNEVNLSVGFRLSYLDNITGILLFLPLALAGFRISSILEMYALCGLYQFFIHVSWVPKLGWLEYIFCTPSAHRVHHDNSGHYRQANFGSVLIIFDRLFGTYQEERDDISASYGLYEPLKSNNPIKIEFHEWCRMFRDLAKSRSLKEVFGYVFRKPGWKP